MPRIPTYDAPQVESRALPGVRQSSVASPALFGAAAEQQVATGRGLMQAGAGLAAATQLMQERENADLIFRAETALKDEYLTYEDDVRTNRRGQGAWGLTRDTEKFFAEQEKKHSGTLTNDVQRQLFNRSVTRLRQSATNAMSQYEAGERRKSIEESANASIVGSINLAAAAATQDDPTPVAGLKSDVLKRVQVLADVNGWTPERKQFEEAKHLTNLHKQVIQNLTDKAPDRARQYFEANKAEINGTEYDGITRVLSVGEARGEAQRAVDAVMNASDNADFSEGRMLDEIRDAFKDKPAVRDAAVAEFKTRMAEKRSMREQGQRTAADTAWGIYGRTGRLADVPAGVLASMDGKDYAVMQEHAANKATGKGVVTDFATYYDLRKQALENPDEFRKLDLRRYIGKLSPGDLEEMAKLQTAKPHEIKDAATLSQQLGNTHDLLGWGSSERDKKGAFDKAVTDAVNTEQQRKGKSLTYEERQSVIDRMVIEGDVNGAWPGGGRRFYEVQGTEDAAKFAPKISDTDRKVITERYKARIGRAPNEAEVVQTFKKWKGL